MDGELYSQMHDRRAITSPCAPCERAANTCGVPKFPSSSRLAWFHILRSGAAQPHEDNAENGPRGETAHGEVIEIRVCSGNRLHPR